MILKKINSKELSFSNNEFETSIKGQISEKLSLKDDYKSRVFAFIFKNIKAKKIQFKPIGVNLDEEKIPDWKVNLVLLGNINEAVETKEQKLLKICFPCDEDKNYFAIAVDFEYSCKPYIEYANSLNLLSDESFQKSNFLKEYQNKILENNLNKKYKNKNKISFIEKRVSEGEEEEKLKIKSKKEKNDENFIDKPNKDNKKTFAIDSLVTKFSIDELNKIKSLIKFSKKNKIMDIIYNKKGEIDLLDLVKVIKPDVFLKVNERSDDIIQIKNTLVTVNNNISFLSNIINNKNNIWNNQEKIINEMKDSFEKEVRLKDSFTNNIDSKVNGIAEMLITLSGITTEFFNLYKKNIESNQANFKFKQVELTQLEELIKQEQKEKKEWIALEEKSKIEKEDERLKREKEIKEKEALRKQLEFEMVEIEKERKNMQKMIEKEHEERRRLENEKKERLEKQKELEERKLKFELEEQKRKKSLEKLDSEEKIKKTQLEKERTLIEEQIRIEKEKRITLERERKTIEEKLQKDKQEKLEKDKIDKYENDKKEKLAKEKQILLEKMQMEKMHKIEMLEKERIIQEQKEKEYQKLRLKEEKKLKEEEEEMKKKEQDLKKKEEELKKMKKKIKKKEKKIKKSSGSGEKDIDYNEKRKLITINNTKINSEIKTLNEIKEDNKRNDSSKIELNQHTDSRNIDTNVMLQKQNNQITNKVSLNLNQIQMQNSKDNSNLIKNQKIFNEENPYKKLTGNENRIMNPPSNPKYVKKDIKDKNKEKGISPFLTNSFDNLEDDDVIDISSKNRKSSIDKNKKKNGFAFDDEFEP